MVPFFSLYPIDTREITLPCKKRLIVSRAPWQTVKVETGSFYPHSLEVTCRVDHVSHEKTLLLSIMLVG